MAKKSSKSQLNYPIPKFLLATDKRTVILRAALIRFLTDGYSETSMDAVTEEAGVSKATVYAHFESKQVLFETLLKEGAAAVFAEFPTLRRGSGNPADELYAFFEPVLQHILVDGGCAWDRLVISEAVRNPELAKIFYQCAIERITLLVESYLEALHQEGLTNGIDLKLQADLLLSMVIVGPLHRTLLLGPNTVDFRTTLRFGIRLFLQGVGS